MLVPITDLPANVIGFDVSDALTTEDYRDVLLPALQRAAEVGEVRVVIVIPAFDGMTGGAALAGMAPHRPRHRRRVDATRHRVVRMDDARRREALPIGSAGRGDFVGRPLTERRPDR